MHRVRVAATAAIVVGFVCACGPSAPDTRLWPLRDRTVDENGTEPDDVAPAIGYGWQRAITGENFDAAAEKKSGKATTTLSGHGLHEIVSDADIAVRADGNACTSCHEWAAKESKDDFCARVPAFLALPTATGAVTDPESAKPKVIKDLLSRWKEAGCPD